MVCLGVRLTRDRTVTANSNCQLDEIYNLLGGGSLDTPVGEMIFIRLTEVRRSTHCKWHNFLGKEPGQYEKERVRWT